MEAAYVRRVMLADVLAGQGDSTDSTSVDNNANDESTTNSDGAGGDHSADAPAPRKRKKRRSTHQVRREEMEALNEQIAELQERLQTMEQETFTDKLELHRAVVQRAQLTSSVEVNHMALGGTQSMISAFTNSGWQSPLASPIHLTTDPNQRRAELAALYERKIDMTTKFLLERSRFLDLRREQCQTDAFDLANGDFVFTRFDVTTFGRAHTPKRIFDEMMLFLSHQEISITEDLGILTLVDAQDVDTSAVRHNRLVSSFVDGLEVESNAVLFSKFINHPTEPHGVGCIDYVDRDDLFPDDPTQRLRKDITSGGMIAACPPDVDGEPPVVSLSRYISVRLQKPAFELTKTQEAAVRESMRVWGSVMVKTMKERLGVR